jgi:hypothetical protein
MRFIIRALLVFLVVSAVLSMIRGMFASSTPTRRAPGPATAGRLVKDPVCGTYIPEETAVRANDKFFCSEECRQKFISA